MKLRNYAIARNPRPQPAPALIALLCCAISAPAHTERAVFNFNPSWCLAVADPANAHEVAFDDSLWKLVTFPRPRSASRNAFRRGAYSACMFCLTVSISDAIASAAFLPAIKAWSEL